MSKGEVERIWLPFTPWLLVASAALAPVRSRRPVGLARAPGGHRDRHRVVGAHAVVSERVLVVEDDPTVAEVVDAVPRTRRVRGRGVSDGALALDRALLDLPAIVVLDLMLPGHRRTRGLPPAPRRCAGTGDHAHCARRRGGPRLGLELGADDYLAKPFSPRELTARVKAVLRRAQQPLADRRLPSESTSTASSSTSALARSPSTASPVSAHRPRVRPARVPRALRHAARSAARSSSNRCGASPSATPRRSPCTCAGCARRSRGTRRNHVISSPSGASATGSTHETDRERSSADDRGHDRDHRRRRWLPHDRRRRHHHDVGRRRGRPRRHRGRSRDRWCDSVARSRCGWHGDARSVSKEPSPRSAAMVSVVVGVVRGRAGPCSSPTRISVRSS